RQGHTTQTKAPMGWLRRIAIVFLMGAIPARRSGAAGAVQRSARPRALPLHAIAARPLHAAKSAGQAAVALGVHPARRVAGKAAIAADAGLLTIGVCGVLAADTSAGSSRSAPPRPRSPQPTLPSSSPPHP